jgi:hypothetical protein
VAVAGAALAVSGLGAAVRIPPGLFDSERTAAFADRLVVLSGQALAEGVRPPDIEHENSAFEPPRLSAAGADVVCRRVGAAELECLARLFAQLDPERRFGGLAPAIVDGGRDAGAGVRWLCPACRAELTAEGKITD